MVHKGASQKTVALPFIDTTYWTSKSTSETALSAVVKRHGLALPNPNEWLFATGSGNGVTCALGEGCHLLATVQNPVTAQFLDCACRCDNRHFALAWLKLLLDPKKSDDARMAIGISNFPDAGFTTRRRFEQWWNINKRNVQDFLGQPVGELNGNPSSTEPAK